MNKTSALKSDHVTCNEDCHPFGVCVVTFASQRVTKSECKDENKKKMQKGPRKYF